MIPVSGGVMYQIDAMIPPYRNPLRATAALEAANPRWMSPWYAPVIASPMTIQARTWVTPARPKVSSRAGSMSALSPPSPPAAARPPTSTPIEPARIMKNWIASVAITAHMPPINTYTDVTPSQSRSDWPTDIPSTVVVTSVSAPIVPAVTPMSRIMMRTSDTTRCRGPK